MTFWTRFVAPILLAVALDWFLVRKQRALWGYLLGLGLLLSAWVILVAWAIYSCNECMKSPTCWCEGTGIGIFFTTVATIASVFIFSLLALTITLHYKKTVSQNALAFVTYGWLVITLWASFTSLGGLGIAELWNSGFFVPWKKLPNPPGQVVGLVEVNLDEIAVEVFPGKTFVAQLDQSNNCRPSDSDATYPLCWSQIEFVRKIPERLACPNYIHLRVPPPPGEILSDRQQFSCNENLTEQINLVLLQDHRLWLWRHRITNQEATQTRTLFVGIGSVIGLTTGLLVILHKWHSDQTSFSSTLAFGWRFGRRNK